MFLAEERRICDDQRNAPVDSRDRLSLGTRESREKDSETYEIACDKLAG